MGGLNPFHLEIDQAQPSQVVRDAPERIRGELPDMDIPVLPGPRRLEGFAHLLVGVDPPDFSRPKEGPSQPLPLRRDPEVVLCDGTRGWCLPLLEMGIHGFSCPGGRAEAIEDPSMVRDKQDQFSVRTQDRCALLDECD